MITYLKGKLIAKNPPFLVIENAKVGYSLQASMQTFYQLPDIGEDVSLHTLLFIKEEMPWLYGFLKTNERQLFQELVKVNTIGPKAALAILSSMDIQQLHQTVIQQNLPLLQSIPGIGKKTAERLLLELTNRLKYWQPVSASTQGKSGMPNESEHMMSQVNIQDATDALIALGYKAPLASSTINRIAEPSLTTETLIRRALHQLMQS